MTFNITYDPSVAAAPAAFVPAVNAAVQILQSELTTPITINLNIGWGEVGGSPLSFTGQSSTNQQGPFTYAQVRSALVSRAKSPADVTAVATLPSTDPTGGKSFLMSNAHAKALGLLSANATGNDGSVGFSSTASFAFDPNRRFVPGAVDFIGLALHEFTEVMGRYGLTQNGSSTRLSPLDLFRYSSQGVRYLAATQIAGTYFSIDGGATSLNTFNGASGFDFSDWTPTKADAFNAMGCSACSGEQPMWAADLAVMDVIGYDTNLALLTTRGDYDGDGKADLVVFRPDTGAWWVVPTSSGKGTVSVFGQAADIPVPGDYDGDYKADLAVYRPSTGMWYVLLSGRGTIASYQWGLNGDVPVPGDYDGDGKTDLAVFRPSNGTWYVATSSASFATTITLAWGGPGDVPVSGDFDGDGKTDPAFYRPSTGTWYVAKSSTSYATTTTQQYGLAGDLPMPGDYDGDGKVDFAVFRPANGTWYIALSGGSSSLTIQWGLAGDVLVSGDYDGDGKTDIAVYRPSTGVWYIKSSSTSFASSTTAQWGLPADVPVPNAAIPYATTIVGTSTVVTTLASMARFSDFDGDGKSDLTLYRPSTGTWFTLRSSTNFSRVATLQAAPIMLGTSADTPVAGDYDGDRRTDAAVYTPATGIWSIRGTTAGALIYQFGLTGDVPVPGDYDGDGRTDLAVYRPSIGTWFVATSTTGYATSVNYQWGLSIDVPVPGDYDGDGKTDLAVYRPATGEWFIKLSTTAFVTSVSYQWGLAGDIAVPGDYDGDGKTDVAVFRPPTGTWYLKSSRANFTTFATTQLGLPSDLPMPGDYDGDGTTDVAVYRPSIGVLWWKDLFHSVFWDVGVPGDIPILRRQ